MSEAETFTLRDLEARIAERAGAAPEESWTARLLAAGPARCAKKFGEEAIELVIALTEGDTSMEGDALSKGDPARGAAGDQGPIVSEAADVLYHLSVALRSRGVAIEAVMAELKRRTGRSGLEEKASRPA